MSNSEDGARRGAAEAGGAGGWQVPHNKLQRGVCAGGKALGMGGVLSCQGPLRPAVAPPALDVDAWCELPRQSSALQPVSPSLCPHWGGCAVVQPLSQVSAGLSRGARTVPGGSGHRGCWAYGVLG